MRTAIIRSPGAAALVAMALAACQPRAAAPPASGPASAPTARGPAGAGAASPTATASAAECDALWTRYHEVVPEDPYVDRDGFVARCARSERAVLSCVERARAEIVDLMRRSGEGLDGGVPEEQRRMVLAMITRIALPPRMGNCVTRARARFAARTGELSELGRGIASGRLRPDVDGALVPTGTSATLAWRGVIEETRTARLAPPGEVRTRVLPDGRIWIYLLGGLLGRHQNQLGFLYSTGSFVPGDFGRGEGGRESVCVGPSRKDASPPQRYLLPCFTVLERLGPQLLEVGAAPD